jgi:hypothetical protein
MEQFIGQAPSNAERDPVKGYYTQVKGRISGLEFNPEDIELYTLVLEYVKRQSPSFQFNYASNFSSDCARAYNTGNTISCGKGIKERIVLSLIPSCTLYLGTDDFKAQKCGPIINALENKEIYKNNVTNAGPSISMIINTFKYPILKKLQEAICYAASNSSSTSASASAKKTNLTAPQAEKKYREMLLQAVYNKIRSKDKKNEIIDSVEAVMKELGAGSEYSPFDPEMICEFAVPMDGGKRKKRRQTRRKEKKMRGKTRRRVVKK